ncbi:carboxymuconolactone decarboxylase family protein [Acidisoma cellulosilytica]|uniref:Carboxymuconolactone decarboxylase family protein n=1 Tax=Acidisoma cellulosilyticum TaxID=2802395 RepID=A0A964E6J1_9PROT|nr:carboxymuconolactone decarboxylase family protein [Acidisoma cellulosilyticum]MCB8883634.1 carboxymuconolactone decarboxylase family protein [Acidisoma cellulosilyticum]
MSDGKNNQNGSDALYEQGVKTFEAAMGQPPTAFIETVDAIAPGYARMILESEFGDAYNRPGLDLRTRELVVIASCGALGVTGWGAMKMHIPAALRAGATRQEIVEVLIQIGFGAGLPTALGALQAAKEVFESLDAAKKA